MVGRDGHWILPVWRILTGKVRPRTLQLIDCAELKTLGSNIIFVLCYKGADKFLARPGSKQATATEDFDVRISYL
jgi:hypothetical protein